MAALKIGLFSGLCRNEKNLIVKTALHKGQPTASILTNLDENMFIATVHIVFYHRAGCRYPDFV